MTPHDVMPHDLEVEAWLLGAMLVSDTAFDRGQATGLAAEDFYGDGHRVTYRAIARMYEGGTPVDSATLRHDLAAHGELEQAGGMAAINTLASEVPAPANASRYAEIVRDLSRDRQLAQAARQAYQSAMNGGVSEVDYDQLRQALAQSTHMAPTQLLIEPWATFRDTTPTEVEYLIDGVIPQGATGLMGAGAKCGKTWLALLAFVCVATGRPFLGRFVVPEPRPVVYVALEGTRSNLGARIGALARGLGVDPDEGGLDQLHLIYKPRIDLRDPSLTSALIHEVLELEAGLVGFDVLRKAAVVRESNEGAPDFREVLANTRPLADAGCAVLYPHHNTKPNADSDKRQAGERLSGSGALYGHADFGIFITSYDRANRVMAVEFSTRDEAELGEMTVRLTGEGSGRHGGFTYTDRCVVTAVADQDAAEQRGEHIEKAITDYLTSNEGASQASVIEGVGGNRDDALATLKRMIRDQVVVIERGPRNAILHWLAGSPGAPLLIDLGEVGRGGVPGASATTSPDLSVGESEGRGQEHLSQPSRGEVLDPDDPGVPGMTTRRAQQLSPVPRLMVRPDEAAAMLGMSLNAFRTYVQPDLRVVRINRLRLIRVTDLERWVRDQPATVAAELVR